MEKVKKKVYRELSLSKKICSGCPDRYEGCRLDWYQDIVDFHKIVVGDNFSTTPHIQYDKKELRRSLISEEIKETLEALETDDIVKIADGIVDSIVVLLGLAVTYGIDIRPIWNEVHRTNMLKIGGKIREDGKCLKPEGWKAPKIKELIDIQINKFT